MPNWRETEKIVIFFGRPLSSEVTQRKENFDVSIMGFWVGEGAKEKMHL